MRTLIAALFAFCLTACATTQTPPYEYETKEPDPAPIIIAQPDPAPLPVPITPPAPPPPAPLPPIIEIYEDISLFDALPQWYAADHRPALAAFKQTCLSWSKAEPYDRLNPNLPEYGQFVDWTAACINAGYVDESRQEARIFFEREFVPVSLSLAEENTGLLTGYYEPEMNVRKVPNKTYSEPILAKPTKPAVLKWPRSKMSPSASRVIAYGKPLEVFFLQIQGSGRIKFEDGRTLRAAYAGNNGYPYTSIGRVLIEKGELSKDQASKRDIEKWMVKAGPKKARDIINKNKRYIFFTEQAIRDNDGPLGGMRVPLTNMGSMAVDPSYHPYGTLAWLNTKIPTEGGDYIGSDTGLLVSAQDTGSAIEGPLRGDLFFGSGDQAGALAGVMKHPVMWTILLPAALAMRQAPVS